MSDDTVLIEKCQNCRFFDKWEPARGDCLRYPPTRNTDDVCVWPDVGDYDWCGEWAKAPLANPAIAACEEKPE
jgi:hypothetical protein